MNSDRRTAGREEFIEVLQKLTLMDDIFMKVVFKENIPASELILQVVLQDPSIKVVEATGQKDLSNLVGHEAALDVFAVDSENRQYDIEFQRDDRKNERERAIFNAALMLTNGLAKGNDYVHIPSVTIAFLNKTDIFKNNEPLMDFAFRDASGTILKGSPRIIFVNGENKDCSTDLGKLVHDIQCATPGEMFFDVLKSHVGYYKAEEKEVGKMCELIENLVAKHRAQDKREARAEGKIEGFAEGKIAVALAMLRGGIDGESIEKFSGIPLKTIKAEALRLGLDVGK